MISTKQCVNIIVSDNLFLEDALYNDYLNLSSFALYIQSRVEQMTKKEVTIGSIKIALSRIAKEQQKIIHYRRMNSDSIFIRKNINLLSLNNTLSSHKLIKEFQSMDIWEDKNYFGIIQGITEIDVIYSQNLMSGIEYLIKQNEVKLKLNNLGIIGIHLDETLLNTIGIIYNLTKKLAFYNINIINILSTYTEIAFIIDVKDLKKAYEILII